MQKYQTVFDYKSMIVNKQYIFNKKLLLKQRKLRYVENKIVYLQKYTEV